MKVVGLLLVAGVVAVYFYLKNLDESHREDYDTTGRMVVLTLAGTVFVLTSYIFVTSLQK